MTRPDIAIVQTGCVAQRALRDGAAGCVRAVFERSFYVEMDDQWLCLLPAGGGMGPLNVAVAATALGTLPTLGERAFVRGTTLHVGARRFLFGQTEVWTPPLPDVWSGRSLSAGLALFARALPVSLSGEGLAEFVRGEAVQSPKPVQKAAQTSIAVLRSLTIGGADHDRSSIDDLIPMIGLGPGLTPSGDDCLGGALIAWHLLGLDLLRDGVWARLGSIAAQSTSAISLAHLRAAAEGFGHEALHGLLNAILSGTEDAMAGSLARVAAIGHTSGWDALAGAITVLRASPASRSYPL